MISEIRIAFTCGIEERKGMTSMGIRGTMPCFKALLFNFINLFLRFVFSLPYSYDIAMVVISTVLSVYMNIITIFYLY